MKLLSKSTRAGLMLAAILPFASGALFAQAADAPTPTPAKETPLHEIGGSSQAPAAVAPKAAPASPAPALAAQAPAAPAAPAPAAVAAAPAPTEVPAAPAKKWHHHDNGDNNKVTVGDRTYVGPNETVEDNAVAVMGPVTIDGTVDGNAVSIMGLNTVNGTVHGNAVAVLSDLKLGPNAHIGGNAVSVGGNVVKDPTAVVEGNIVPVNLGVSVGQEGAASSFWKHGLKLGRPLAFGPHLHLLWIANLCLAAFYIILVLLFPSGITKCENTLSRRPGITLLTGFLAMLGLPVLGILLLVTVIGIPVALVVLPVGVLACILFGKASIYTMIGRSIVGKQSHLALAAVVGIVVALVFYLIPFLGLAIWFLVAFVGFATALTALFASDRPAPAAAPPVQPGSAAFAAAPVAAVAAPAASPDATAPSAPASGEPPALSPPAAAPEAGPVPPLVAPAVSEASYPKAGFWIRMAALLVDTVLIAIVFHFPPVFLPAMAVYGAVLWKLRGSTIGGIIFRLKVVRMDGKPMDWVTAIVRALACFLSLVFLCLGFIWIGFDPEKQAWHDKIAGTVVVKNPKGISLV
jgi:uncharacterized RDD family membrane protein YckC/cytoskeletal protein CcmA (bactofilin family)